jgi:hypothetical protein
MTVGSPKEKEKGNGFWREELVKRATDERPGTSSPTLFSSFPPLGRWCPQRAEEVGSRREERSLFFCFALS